MQTITENGLYENACDYIRFGYEDYFNKQDPKRIKSAVRNIYCGIELLLKAYILKHTSSKFNDTFIHNDIVYTLDKGGDVFPVRGGEVTVTYKKSINIIKRFEFIPEEQINKIVKMEETIGQICKKRNQLEHAHIDHPKEILEDIVLESYSVISELLVLLDESILNILPSELIDQLKKQLHDHERYKKSHINKFHPKDQEAAQYLGCVYCDSRLVNPEKSKERISSANIKCSACGKVFNIGELIDQLISSKSFREVHQNVEFFDGFSSKIFSCLADDLVDRLVEGIKNNNQISWIKDDPDVAEFIKKIPRNVW